MHSRGKHTIRSLAILGAGALVMYWLDLVNGRRRRATVMDRARSA